MGGRAAQVHREQEEHGAGGADEAAAGARAGAIGEGVAGAPARRCGEAPLRARAAFRGELGDGGCAGVSRVDLGGAGAVVGCDGGARGAVGWGEGV